MKTKTEATLDMNEIFNLFVSGADANITFLTDAGAMASVEECCETIRHGGQIIALLPDGSSFSIGYDDMCHGVAMAIDLWAIPVAIILLRRGVKIPAQHAEAMWQYICFA